jgi:glutamine phosphoribosylpyrophosphate amidotransferase
MSERLVTYRPEIFEVVDDVAGDRIVLVEDTWIRGATALSAAGALLSAGAGAVVITPIARDVKPSFHGEDHPYLSYLTAGYDITAWPRS